MGVNNERSFRHTRSGIKWNSYLVNESCFPSEILYMRWNTSGCMHCVLCFVSNPVCLKYDLAWKSIKIVGNVLDPVGTFSIDMREF